MSHHDETYSNEEVYMAPRPQSLIGKTVRVMGHSNPMKVVAVEDGLLICYCKEGGGYTHGCTINAIDTIIVPKAIPGVIYRRKSDSTPRCGHHDGRLWSDHAANALIDMTEDWEPRP